jgi:hypothetical protein
VARGDGWGWRRQRSQTFSIVCSITSCFRGF